MFAFALTKLATSVSLSSCLAEEPMYVDIQTESWVNEHKCQGIFMLGDWFLARQEIDQFPSASQRRFFKNKTKQT